MISCSNGQGGEGLGGGGGSLWGRGRPGTVGRLTGLIGRSEGGGAACQLGG